MYLKESNVYHSNNISFDFDNIILLAICLQFKGQIGM